jgi:hypothetical protein
MHHLGVLLFLIEAELLGHVTQIWAEDWAVPLAVLVKARWDVLTGAHKPTAELLHHALIRPVLALVAGGPALFDEVLITHWNLSRGTASEPLRWWSESETLTQGLPALHLTYRAAVGRDFFLTYYTDESLSMQNVTVLGGLALMQSELSAVLDHPLANRAMPLWGETHYKTLWHALADHLLQIPRTVCLSHAGQERLPPIDAKSLGCVCASELKNAWEFCGFTWRCVLEHQALATGVDVVVYSPYSNDGHHIVDAQRVETESQSLKSMPSYRQTVCGYYARGKDEAVTNRMVLTNMLNWGYLVAWTAETVVAETKGCQKPQVVRDTHIKLPRSVSTVELVDFRARQKRMASSLLNLSEPLSLTQGVTPGAVEPTRTPCKWLIKWWNKDN